MKSSENWFHDWFNTSYYHLLYAHRSDEEAQNFIEKIITKHHWPVHSYVLDLACGKGRHSNYLASKNMKVLGIDLSEKNIEFATENAHPNAKFQVGDMREIPFENTFDIVVNLFTSFGYFDDPTDNTKVLQQIFTSLKPGGYFLFDYLNPPYVLKKLHTTTSLYCGEIHIQTKKRIANDWVLKDIKVKDGNQEYEYQEQVNLISADWLQTEMEKIGFKIIQHYGNYSLQNFNAEQSPRSIFLAQKVN